MATTINPFDPRPKYLQLIEILQKRIEDETWEPNSPIPSEHELEEIYKISRPTIRQALDSLIRKGYLYRVQGKGTFIAPVKLNKGIMELTSFSEDMKSKGLIPGQKILIFERMVPSAKILKKLAIEDVTTSVLRIKRIRYGNEIPIGLQDAYLALNDSQLITLEEIEQIGSIYEILQRKFGIFPAEAEETLEVVLPTEEEADFLQINQQQPLLLNQRVLWSQTQQIIEFVKILYRGDRYKYHLHLRRNSI